MPKTLSQPVNGVMDPAVLSGLKEYLRDRPLPSCTEVRNYLGQTQEYTQTLTIARNHIASKSFFSLWGTDLCLWHSSSSPQSGAVAGWWCICGLRLRSRNGSSRLLIDTELHLSLIVSKTWTMLEVVVVTRLPDLNKEPVWQKLLEGKQVWLDAWFGLKALYVTSAWIWGF